MSQRKLHKVASSAALREWALSCPEGTYAGLGRVETQHATYLFRNGSCFAISGRGARGGTTSTDLVGMKIAGWLLPDSDPGIDDEARRRIDAGGIRVSRNWRPGARAVLFGKTGFLGGLRLALTSPVDSFTLYADGEIDLGATPDVRPVTDRVPHARGGRDPERGVTQAAAVQTA